MLRKMLHKPTFVASIGKDRCCLLNGMVHLTQADYFTPDFTF